MFTILSPKKLKERTINPTRHAFKWQNYTTNLRDLLNSQRREVTWTQRPITRLGHLFQTLNSGDSCETLSHSGNRSSAFQGSAETTAGASANHTASYLAMRPKTSPFWNSPASRQQAPSRSIQNRHTGKVRGIFSPPLTLQEDLWVPLIQAPCPLPLWHTHQQSKTAKDHLFPVKTTVWSNNWKYLNRMKGGSALLLQIHQGNKKPWGFTGSGQNKSKLLCSNNIWEMFSL